jgi:hypothetical protein
MFSHFHLFQMIEDLAKNKKPIIEASLLVPNRDTVLLEDSDDESDPDPGEII